MPHLPHIHYRIPNGQFRDLMLFAYERCTEYWIDKLYGFRRRRVNMTFEDFLKIWEDSPDPFNTCVHRRGDIAWKNNDIPIAGSWCIEVGSVAEGLFLWIYLDEVYLDIIEERFDLKRLN